MKFYLHYFARIGEACPALLLGLATDYQSRTHGVFQEDATLNMAVQDRVTLAHCVEKVPQDTLTGFLQYCHEMDRWTEHGPKMAAASTASASYSTAFSPSLVVASLLASLPEVVPSMDLP
jgi:hypothetical protein